MNLEEIYKALRSEYNGSLFSDNFLTTHIDLIDGDQIICWFEEDDYYEDIEDKRDSAVMFYDEVVRFLVDKYGDNFKFTDPRVSDDYIDKCNFRGEFEIVVDDDNLGDSHLPSIVIWENEESGIKSRFDEG